MSIAASADLGAVLAGSPYAGYCYGYPHKTAYRPLTPVPQDVWRDEDTRSLFLYLHVPFCEHRCGFCNLFTLARPGETLPQQYLAALRRQAEATREALRQPQFARLAIGGGTPTFLSTEELAELFSIASGIMGARLGEIPISCEASPATLSAEKLALLKEAGVTRLSLGVQSFNADDAHAMGRPYRPGEVEQALDLLAAADFPVVNLDLIYGAESQTESSWLASVERAIEFGAEEIYLYPLYVRPLTGLGRLGRQWDDFRLSLYRAGRNLLWERGYQQVSMRMFRRPESAAECGPVYCCQDDGMVGLGCGARSYTRTQHYSREYAVGTPAVAGILADYLRCSHDQFANVDFGLRLDAEEQRRRMVILSLLQAEGLSRPHYERRFASDALHDFPQLESLVEHDLAACDGDALQLTAAGLERSDAIGPWLYSPAVLRRMEDYAWR